MGIENIDNNKKNKAGVRKINDQKKLQEYRKRQYVRLIADFKKDGLTTSQIYKKLNTYGFFVKMSRIRSLIKEYGINKDGTIDKDCGEIDY